MGMGHHCQVLLIGSVVPYQEPEDHRNHAGGHHRGEGPKHECGRTYYITDHSPKVVHQALEFRREGLSRRQRLLTHRLKPDVRREKHNPHRGQARAQKHSADPVRSGAQPPEQVIG